MDSELKKVLLTVFLVWVFLMVGLFSIHFLGMGNDNVVEEFSEDVIRSLIGISLDISEGVE